MERERWHIRVQGIVQGVGFRPFVFRLAVKFKLCGWVKNDAEGVLIEAEGERCHLQDFFRSLQEENPPAAHITAVSCRIVPVRNEEKFIIAGSDISSHKDALISADIAICQNCREEILSKRDRRCGYPFTNCTDCGPRYTITMGAPYDRERTSMKVFKMCEACEREYNDPADRRFHAQPNACPDCGPRLLFRKAGSTEADVSMSDDVAVTKAREVVKQGLILAVKGIGGFHLAVNATDEQAAVRLRSRKSREKKPFAVMAGSIERIRQFAEVSEEEEKLLTSSAAPIVLLRKKQKDYDLASSIAPDNAFVGVMLPYAPLHVLLIKPSDVWVMTSGNASGEPQIADNWEAEQKLAKIADAFLFHNRDIINRIDDSVMYYREEQQVVRRGRGLAPVPVSVGDGEELLAGGAEKKSAFCYVREGQAFLSEYLGDLKNKAVYDDYRVKLLRYQELFSFAPECLVCDLHPDYFSTRLMTALAKEKNLPLFKVQHHKAHIASVLAEHEENNPVIGLAFDGTGYGEDGNVWGGEFFVGSIADLVRQAHFKYFPLPGGEKTAAEPWRLALWVLHGLYKDELPEKRPDFAEYYRNGGKLLMEAVEKGVNAPLSSSVGRLFDAAAALLGITYVNTYEGEAACALEQAALKADRLETLSYEIYEKDDMIEIDFVPALQELARRFDGTNAETLASAFHNAVAMASVEVINLLRDKFAIKKVAVSGGVFQNRLLAEFLTDGLPGYTVLKNKAVPANDGGIAYGQAAIVLRRRRG